MYKFIFELITSPLGLPLPVLSEYIILIIIHEIAFQIAFNSSSGGKWGSEIHWAIRIPTFIILWLLVYGFISLIKWLFRNWILILTIIGLIIVILGIILIIKKRINKSK